MDEKKNSLFTVGILVSILIVFVAADFFRGDRLYSELENRVLAGRPEFTRESFLDGGFAGDYEEYITDQFVGRDKWVAIKTRTDILFQKKEINGVYLGRDDYLLEQHLPEDYTKEQEQEKIALLKKLVDEWDARVMLVPTADNVLADKLPAYAPCYDQAQFLEEVWEQIGERSYIDVYSILQEHEKEEIYYRTDHHWTSLGAYYGYVAWTQGTHSFLYPYNIENMTTVSDDFQGSLYSKAPVVSTTDSIQVIPSMEDRPVSVTYDFGRTADSFYEESYLDAKNQYGYFLDDNHAFIEIQTDYNNDKTLFVIKDSYANCMIPLLQPHYKTIYVVDPRYYNGPLPALMERCEPEGGMDVLVLYNCAHFMEDFRY